jgi:thioredoxin 1
MSVDKNQSGDITTIRYELSLSEEEARQGVSRILPRNGKRLEVVVPPGVTNGSLVKLTNALQRTDDKPGDIIITIKLKELDKAGTQVPEGVVEITDATFSAEVLSGNLTVVVDFWASWCGPCRMMSPVVEQAADLYKGKVKFCKINVDENPAMAAQYQAMSIPMLLFFRNGKVIVKSVGAIPLNQLKAKVDALLQ